MKTETVSNIQDFKTKWGIQGWELLLQAFIARAPAFPGDTELAKKIAEFSGDLITVLENEGKDK